MDFVQVIRNAVHLPTCILTIFVVEAIILPFSYKRADGQFVKRKRFTLFVPMIGLALALATGAGLSFLFSDVAPAFGALSGLGAFAILILFFDLAAGLIKAARKTG